MIEIEDETRLPQPDIAILYHRGMDRDILRKAFLLLPHTMKPKFFNNPLAVEHLRRKGVRESEVHDLSNLGCVTAAVSGATWGPTNYGFVNLGKCVELALHNGWDPLRGKRVGPETGAASGFQHFDDLYQAFLLQVNYGVSQLVIAAHALETVHRDFLPLPFASLMVEDCI
jgi:formate C-acetyltransferase